MRNLTLLSLVISNSLTRSPFLQISPSANFVSNYIRNVNTNYFLSSFLTVNTYSSFKITDSKFNNYITSMPILSLGLKICKLGKNDPINECVWYGENLMLPESKPPSNVFNYGTISHIANCQFMSIKDDPQLQLENNHGLCIYIDSQNASVSQCYFFAIQSSRSGSAIYFNSNSAVDSNLSNKVDGCIFKSINQIAKQDFCEGFLIGGAVSFGQADLSRDIDQNLTQFVPTANSYSVAENSVFINNALVPENNVNNYQLGMVTFLSMNASCKNVNFTSNRVNRHGQLFGLITSFFHTSTEEHSIKFINMFDNTYSRYGLFTTYITYISTYNSLELSHFNIMNNTLIDELAGPLFVNYYQEIVNSLPAAAVSTIYSNADSPFFNQLTLDSEKVPIQTFHINLQNSVFASSAIVEGSKLILDSNENNKFNVKDVFPTYLDFLDTLPIRSTFKTHVFSASDKFTPRFVVNSPSLFDLKSNTLGNFPGILATVFGILSLFAFIFLLYLRSGFRKKFHIIGFFEKRDSFDEVYHSEEGGYGNDATISSKMHFHNDEESGGLGEVENQTNENIDIPNLPNRMLPGEIDEFSD